MTQATVQTQGSSLTETCQDDLSVGNKFGFLVNDGLNLSHWIFHAAKLNIHYIDKTFNIEPGRSGASGHIDVHCGSSGQHKFSIW